jgi:hypothetical protein
VPVLLRLAEHEVAKLIPIRLNALESARKIVQGFIDMVMQ